MKHTNEHKLKHNNGKTLAQRIIELVPNGMVEYQKNKSKLRKNVGYGENGFLLQFDASPEEMTRHFLEAALGLPSKMEVKNTVLKDNRFNCPIMEDKSESAHIEVLPNIIDKCVLNFKTDEYSPLIAFSAELLTVPQLKTGKNSVYLRTQLFSIELVDDNNFLIRLTIEKKVL